MLAFVYVAALVMSDKHWYLHMKQHPHLHQALCASIDNTGQLEALKQTMETALQLITAVKLLKVGCVCSEK